MYRFLGLQGSKEVEDKKQTGTMSKKTISLPADPNPKMQRRKTVERRKEGDLLYKHSPSRTSTHLHLSLKAILNCSTYLPGVS
jgi:hypothetical protein